MQACIKETCKAQSKALKVSKKALEDLQVARARKEQLQQQIDLLDSCAKAAIAVEDRNIKELERREAGKVIEFLEESLTVSLLLSPST